MMTSNGSLAGSLLLLAIVAPQCASFSALAPPESLASLSSSSSSSANPFAVPMAQFKRSNLKKQLIKAANDKDEAAVLGLVEELAPLNPNPFGTYGLGGYGGGSASDAPLDGEWRLLFTNARDAEAPAKTQKGAGVDEAGDGRTVAEGVRITTGQRIDASTGKCLNYINATGEKRPFDSLQITIQMTPLSPSRVRLDFQSGRAQNDNALLPFLKDVSFGFPPAFVGDVLARVRGKDPEVEPPAYFDVLYIDGDIRAHKTGEGKIFVQARQLGPPE